MSAYVVNPYLFGSKFWVFDGILNEDVLMEGIPATISNFTVTTSGGTQVTVDWGDGTSQLINSGSPTSKTFNSANAGLELNSQELITQINCGTSATKFAGSIDVSDFSNLTSFTCNNFDVAAIIGYASIRSLKTVTIPNNKLTGSIPNLSVLSQLEQFQCYQNQFTGSIPNLSNNTELRVFSCSDNPSMSGSIPNLSANTKLETFGCRVCGLTGFSGGTVSNTLGNFVAQNNNLTATAVNAILAAFVAANRTTGTRILNLGGGGNAAPTGQGITDKATLVSRGWTVTTN